MFIWIGVWLFATVYPPATRMLGNWVYLFPLSILVVFLGLMWEISPNGDEDSQDFVAASIGFMKGPFINNYLGKPQFYGHKYDSDGNQTSEYLNWFAEHGDNSEHMALIRFHRRRRRYRDHQPAP